MKRWLTRLTQWRVSAPAAFFLLTLWGLGWYIVYSLFLFLLVPGWLDFLLDCDDLWLLLAIPYWCWIITGLGAVGAMLLFFHRIAQQVCSGWLMRWCVAWGTGVLLVLLTAAENWSTVEPTVIWLALCLVTLVFPLLIQKELYRRSVGLVCGNFLCWSGGMFLVGIVWTGLLLRGGWVWEAVEVRRKLGTFIEIDQAAAGFLRLSGSGWAWLLLAGLLLLLAGYGFTAVIWAEAEGVKLRRMFGKKVVVPWGMALSCFVFSLLLALWASQESERDKTALERRFGHPLTSAGLRERYCRSGSPDPEFWNRLAMARKEVARQTAGPLEEFCNRSPRWFQLHSEELERLREGFGFCEKPLQELDRAFGGVLLRGERRLSEEEAVQFEDCCGEIIQSYLLWGLWRLRSALAEQDGESALAIYRRMENCNTVGIVNWISGVGWISGEEKRLDALELLLESGLCSSGWLRQAGGKLAASEKKIDEIEEEAFYADVVFILDALETEATRETVKAGSFSYRVAQPGKLRFLFPQLWWYCAADRRTLLQAYNVPGLRDVPEKELERKPYVICSIVLPGTNGYGNRFLMLKARCRAMRALIAAELSRRENGAWPEKLEPMPIDPFSGKPLLYRAGTQVWSVGPNGIDEDGLGGYDEAVRRQCDDIRAIVRIGE
ncbi:hypothetical protein [uncultured Victivallis sp.]|uniref:hypothetical protein n=1 Tax=uncultured Victivallis sp. TaxID=354118 RepID=UPI002583D9FB|nr:hypothetical protein [uncultured Victivallis sp.]